MTEAVGIARCLTNYGDPDFALTRGSMGYSTDLFRGR